MCKELSDDFINPHKHPLFGGDYDANIIILATQRQGLKTHWIDKRKPYEMEKKK